MRICLITQPNDFIDQLVLNLNKKGIKTSAVISLDSKKKNTKKIKSFCNSFNDKVFIDESNFWLVEKNTDLQSKIKYFFKSNKFDIVITDAIFPSGFLARIPKSLDIPVIAFTYGIDVLHIPSINYGFKSDPRKRKLIPPSLKFIDGYIGTAQSIKHLYKNWKPKSKLYYKTIIPTPKENRKRLKKTGKIRKKWGINKNQPVILSMFRIYPEKGQEYIIRAFQSIKSKIPNILLLIVGSKGKGYYYKKLYKLIKKYNLENNVSFIDFVEKK